MKITVESSIAEFRAKTSHMDNFTFYRYLNELASYDSAKYGNAREMHNARYRVGQLTETQREQIKSSLDDNIELIFRQVRKNLGDPGGIENQRMQDLLVYDALKLYKDIGLTTRDKLRYPLIIVSDAANWIIRYVMGTYLMAGYIMQKNERQDMPDTLAA